MTEHRYPPYQRYEITTKSTPNIILHPYRFKVRVKKLALAKLLIKELFHYHGKLDVIFSRPCVYGVFSGPIGGFAPREQLCVGCLRCTVQYPEMVAIVHNPKRTQMGDSYFTPDQVDTIVYESEYGRIPIKGAGYRGKFGGEGWDSMWTDMSEIVRPTRDGIHGREYISTEVDMGEKLASLKFDEELLPIGVLPNTISIPLPLLFDTLPSSNISSNKVCQILSETARETQTFTILPFECLSRFSLKKPQIIPLLNSQDFGDFLRFDFEPLMIEMENWNEEVYRKIRSHFPHTLPILRTDFESNLLSFFRSGVRIFHLVANYKGRGRDGVFVLELIRQAHLAFVRAGCRNEVTLIGSGGIIAAEHLSKAVICGLDAVALDTPVLVALQAKFRKECISRGESDFQLPQNLTVEWGQQRLKNLLGAWRDQLLEILGAMGIRDVKRLRGEIGRSMFQNDLEKEAFTGIKGYDGK